MPIADRGAAEGRSLYGLANFADVCCIAGSLEIADNRTGSRSSGNASDRDPHCHAAKSLLSRKGEVHGDRDARRSAGVKQDGGNLPACRFACHEALARKDALLIPAEVTAARAKIRSLQHGRRFEMVGLMAQSLQAMRGAL